MAPIPALVPALYASSTSQSPLLIPPPPAPPVVQVIGWNRRPPPDLDFETFKRDTEELLALLKRTYTRGRLIWWKANYIWPGG